VRNNNSKLMLTIKVKQFRARNTHIEMTTKDES